MLVRREKTRAVLFSFRDMHRDLCHGKEGLCEAMKPTKGTTLLQYLRKVNFEGKLTKRFLGSGYEVRIYLLVRSYLSSASQFYYVGNVNRYAFL